jgi:predicted PurR-regulated permease PerM
MSKTYSRIMAVLLAAALCALIGYARIADFAAYLIKGFTPVFIGLLFALLLLRPYEYLRRRFTFAVKNDKIKKIAKPVSLLAVYGAFLTLIVLFCVFVAPQLVKNIEIFYSNTDSYLMTVKRAVDDILSYLPFDLSDIKIDEETIAKFLFGESLPITRLIESFMGVIKKFAVFAVNLSVGTVLSVYLLASKERLKGEAYALADTYCTRKAAARLKRFFSVTAGTFSLYLSAQLTEALILFGICYAGMLIFGFEYPLIVSAIVGVTNMIPMFGPFIGAVPGVIICLLATPSKTIWFIVFIIAVQQLDNNLIAPKVVGESVGLPPIWVFISLVLAGAFFGVGAMFICVPVATVAYKLLKNAVQRRTAA